MKKNVRNFIGKTLLPASLLTAGFVVTGTEQVNAALITGVTVSTDMGEGFGTQLINTVNGVGLPGNTPALSGNHEVATPSNSWVSNQGVVTGNITFDLGATYDLAGFSFWNFNANSIFGIKDVTIQASTNNIDFTTIIGAPTQFAQGSQFAPVSPETFSFNNPFSDSVTASSIRFVIGSNWGNVNATGFSEVQFDGTEVPEPMTILGSLTALGIGGLFKKKKAHAQ